MSKKNIKDLAEEAIECTKEGVNLFVEIHELQETIKNLPKNEQFEQIIKEIIEKEKVAIALIQQAGLIQRELVKGQREAMERLFNSLP